MFIFELMLFYIVSDNKMTINWYENLVEVNTVKYLKQLM